jgi:hypothetical protein
MDVLPSTLTGAALEARDRLGSLAQRAAAASLGSDRLGSAAAMGAAARAAVFADALLAAIRARLETLRNATK